MTGARSEIARPSGYPFQFENSGEAAYAASLTASPLKVMPCRSAEIATLSPSLTLPDRISSASGSCTAFWIARLSGRAP